MLLLLAGPKVAKGKHLLLLHPPLLRWKYVISNFISSSLFLYRAFLRLTPYTCWLILFFLSSLFFYSLSTKRTHLSPTLYCLMSLSLRYVYLFFSLPFLHLFPLPCVIDCPISPSPLLFASSIIMHFSPFHFFFFFFFASHSSGWAQAYLHISPYGWGGFCRHRHTHGGFLWWGWCGG